MAGESTTGSAASTAPLPQQSVTQKSRWIALIPVAVLLLAGAILFSIMGNWNSWVSSREIQETDDAYVRADLTPLSTRVSGTVARVAVDDYQQVKAGDLLVRLKDEDY